MKIVSLIGMALLAIATAQTPVFAQGPPDAPRFVNVQPGDIRIIASLSIKGPLESVLPAAEKLVGKHIVVEYGFARANLKELIMAGQAFEVALLVPEVNEELLKAGKVTPGAYEIASIPIGFGVRGNADNVKLGTPEEIKQAMLAAKSIKYQPNGAGAPTARNIFSTFNIADKVHDSSGTRVEVELLPGEYEISIFPISEIIANKSLKNMGLVYPPLQIPTVVEAAVGANSNNPAASLAIVELLRSPAIDAGLQASSLEKRHGRK